MNTSTLLLALLTACGGPSEPESGPDPAAAHEVAERLCIVFEKAGRDCTTEGATAKAGDHAVEVHANVEQAVSVAAQTMLELEYTLSIDGQPVPALRTTMVGNGADRAMAREKAAEAWASIYGAAIVDRLLHTGRLGALQALQDDQSPPKAFVADGWVVYPGWTQLQGHRKDKKVIDIDEVLATLSPVIRQWPREEGATHALLVRLEMREGYAPEGECTLDGQPDEALCTLAREYDWPAPGPSYLLKQYFVFAPGPLPGEQAAPAEAEAAPAEAE